MGPELNPSGMPGLAAHMKQVVSALTAHPRLRSLLLLNATIGDVEAAVDYLGQCVADEFQSDVRRVTLAPYHRDDDLWGSPAPLGERGLLYTEPGKMTGGSRSFTIFRI